MKRFLIILSVVIFASQAVFAGREVKDVTFATRDTVNLQLDIYYPEQVSAETPCILYVFGGGFMMGSKRDAYNVTFFRRMADLGYVVVANDYRLGLKGQKKIGVGQVKLLDHAIKMAVEDLYSATNFLIENSAALQINRDMIILCGSSAGAITVLQAQYEAANGHEIAAVLPSDFRYAGLISMAGAVLSFDGKPKYKNYAPAPTLFFHGMTDKIVPYNKIQLFSMGMFGSKVLSQQFEKYDYPYFAFHVKDIGHEIAEMPMRFFTDYLSKFITDYIVKPRHLKINLYLKDPELKPYFNIKNFDDLYKNSDKLQIAAPSE